MQKTNKIYWDNLWIENKTSSVLNPNNKIHPNTFVNKQFHDFFRQVFAITETTGSELLEIGCARSQWLPYFVKEFGFKVSGIDYSEIGCQQASEILSKEGVNGKIVCADFFKPPKSMAEAFDVVISFGVAEHFQNTETCITAFSQFLKPGGLLITFIPNITGLIGWIQKLINRPIFDIHMPLDKLTLQQAHKTSDVRIVDCNYFISFNFGICNLNGIPHDSLSWFIKEIVLGVLIRCSFILWFIEEKIKRFTPNKITGSYVYCVAHKRVHGAID